MVSVSPERLLGVPKGLVNNHWAAFGPRVGFAYDLTGSGKTILRGGFGMMYERIQGNDMYNAGPNVPFSTNINFSNIQLENPGTQLSNSLPSGCTYYGGQHHRPGQGE